MLFSIEPVVYQIEYRGLIQGEYQTNIAAKAAAKTMAKGEIKVFRAVTINGETVRTQIWPRLNNGRVR